MRPVVYLSKSYIALTRRTKVRRMGRDHQQKQVDQPLTHPIQILPSHSLPIYIYISHPHFLSLSPSLHLCLCHSPCLCLKLSFSLSVCVCFSLSVSLPFVQASSSNVEDQRIVIASNSFDPHLKTFIFADLLFG